MKASIHPPAFIFSETIDNAHLFSLYENDYQWIEEIFQTTLLHFDDDIHAVRVNQQSGDLYTLKRAIHKLKPVFGFIGMPLLQEMCREVEDKILQAGSASQVQDEIENLLRCCYQCKAAIDNDLMRLSAFNKSMA